MIGNLPQSHFMVPNDRKTKLFSFHALREYMEVFLVVTSNHIMRTTLKNEHYKWHVNCYASARNNSSR